MSIHIFSVSFMLFSLLKHYLDLYIVDTVSSESLIFFCFTSLYISLSQKLILWGMGISDAIFMFNTATSLTRKA